MKKSVIAIASAVALATSSLVAPAVSAQESSLPDISGSVITGDAAVGVEAGGTIDLQSNAVVSLLKDIAATPTDATVETVEVVEVTTEGWTLNGDQLVAPSNIVAGAVKVDLQVRINGGEPVPLTLPVVVADTSGSADLPGSETDGSGEGSNTDGSTTDGSGEGSNTDGSNTDGSGEGSNTDGSNTDGSGEGSNTDGSNTDGSGEGSNTDGSTTDGSGEGSNTDGSTTDGSGEGSNTDGSTTDGSGEGSNTDGSADGSADLPGSSVVGGSTVLGSSAGNACLPAVLTIGAPLLLLLPLAGLAQVNMPIVNQLTGDMRAEIERFNLQVQGQLGIDNPQLASLAKQFNMNTRQLLQLGGGVLGATAIALAGAYLFSACAPGGSSSNLSSGSSAQGEAGSTGSTADSGSVQADLGSAE